MDSLQPHLVEFGVVANRTHRAGRAEWAAGHFGKVPGDDEFIPLPEK